MWNKETHNKYNKTQYHYKETATITKNDQKGTWAIKRCTMMMRHSNTTAALKKSKRHSHWASCWGSQQNRHQLRRRPNGGKELFHLSSCIQLFHFSQIDNHPAEPGEQMCVSVSVRWKREFLCFIFISSCFIALCVCAVTNIKSLPLIKSALLQSNLLPEVRMTQTERFRD